MARKNNSAVADINSLRSKIRELWTKLKIENPDMSRIVNSPTFEKDNRALFGTEGFLSKRAIIEELTNEYERCVQVKMENMQKFIESIRVDIRALCEKMYFSDKEMKKLTKELLGLNDFTEDLLKMHEEKLENLKFDFDERESIYEKVNKWNQLWNEFIQFEEKTKG